MVFLLSTAFKMFRYRDKQKKNSHIFLNYKFFFTYKYTSNYRPTFLKGSPRIFCTEKV